MILNCGLDAGVGGFEDLAGFYVDDLLVVGSAFE